MTELQQLLAMLERAFIGHGTSPHAGGTAVQVEGEYEGDPIADFVFDEDGKLITVRIGSD